MSSPGRALLRLLLGAAILGLLPSPSASGQEPQPPRTPHDPLGLWAAKTAGWNLPLASSAPPHHHRVLAQPASLELWGRPIRFGYFAGRQVDRPLGQRFAFGESRIDVVWIGETRQALARQVLDRCAEGWSKESAPRNPEAAWDAPLAGEPAWNEARERLGRRAWGDRLRERGSASTIVDWARARGQHEVLFALGALIAGDPNASAPSPEATELAGLLAALGHSHHPHELLRGELDAATRLGSEGSAPRLLDALREGWGSLAPELTPELDRERQALAQLDRASAQTLRLGARAAMQRQLAPMVSGDRAPQTFPESFRLEQRRTAGGESSDAIPGLGASLRFEGGRAKLERGRFAPWSEEVAIAPDAEGSGAFALSGNGVLLLYFQAPATVSSASLRLRHRLAVKAGDGAAGLLVTIDGAPVLDGSNAIPGGDRGAVQSFDLGELVHKGYPNMLMISLAPGSPRSARYWLAELEVSIEE
ncbi:MAG: hypothetical protein IPN34_21640 [Planctomycetes bacterium]|nr:hypothetical protein [Planctomycetota bacterium]